VNDFQCFLAVMGMTCKSTVTVDPYYGGKGVQAVSFNMFALCKVMNVFRGEC
jgi:hypothetical protein